MTNMHMKAIATYTDKYKQQRLLIIAVVVMYYFGNIFSQHYMKQTDNLAINKIVSAISNIEQISFIPSFAWENVVVGLIAGGILGLVILSKRKKQKSQRLGVEYGSARWGQAHEIKPYMSNNPYDNIILTESEGLSMAKYMKNPEHNRNKNVCVVGSSGSGKTRFYIKPNLMQMHSNYVLADPKGTCLNECGKMFADAGYNIKIFNTINFNKSMHYNPFAYVKNELDIMSLVTTLINNTKGEGEKSGEDFWVKAEKLLYISFIAYMFEACTKEERNFETLLDMLVASKVREDSDDYKNAIDLIFEDWEAINPESFAVYQYKQYKLAAGKTAKSILISCAARLAPFSIPKLKEITRYDDMDLLSLGYEKTILFVITSDTDPTFNFLAAIMYTQLFNKLCTLADDVMNGSLPYHVRFLIDEFANIGTIPHFKELIATIRSRNMSVTIVLQAISQLKTMYKDATDTILGNCDTFLFLGGQEKSTLKEICETLGKETIKVNNDSKSYGNQKSWSRSSNTMARELMTVDELAVMDNKKCILIIRGLRPFFSNKYDITKHANYKLLSDYDSKLNFDVAAYLAMLSELRRQKINNR